MYAHGGGDLFRPERKASRSSRMHHSWHQPKKKSLPFFRRHHPPWERIRRGGKEGREEEEETQFVFHPSLSTNGGKDQEQSRAARPTFTYFQISNKNIARITI